MYDKNNIFAKIIRGEIPAKKVYENEYALSFFDVNPCAETHVLVIPKGEYENILEFNKRASDAEKLAFWDCFVKTTEKVGVEADFNIVANAGKKAPLVQQSIFHFHLHILAGNRTDNFPDFLGQ